LKVLVVQEKYCAPANRGLWKIPTGFVLQVVNFEASLHPSFLNASEKNRGGVKFCFVYVLYSNSIFTTCLNVWQSEEIYAGAVREVKEETGVRIRYSSAVTSY